MATPNTNENILENYKNFLTQQFQTNPQISVPNKDSREALDFMVTAIQHADSFATIKEILKSAKSVEGLDSSVSKQVMKHVNDPQLTKGINAEKRVNSLIEIIAERLKTTEKTLSRYSEKNIPQTYGVEANSPEYPQVKKLAEEKSNYFSERKNNLDSLVKELNNNKYDPNKCKKTMENAYKKSYLDTSLHELKTKLNSFSERISEKINQFRRGPGK